jgi:uncharacterized protein (TIGR03437 family)
VYRFVRTLAKNALLVLIIFSLPSTSADTLPPIHIIPVGSSLTFGGTNSPDTYSDTVTFGPAHITVDKGAVTIWQEQIATAANAEWEIFHVQTTNGGPLAGNINANWNIVMTYTLSAPVFFDQVASQWQVNGTPAGPVSNFGSICCATTSAGILQGPGFYNSGFSSPLSAGPQVNWQEIFVNPYTANGFVFALHFTLQPGMPTVTQVISAGAFGAFPIFGPGSWIEIYGSNLASITQTWANSDFSGINAPTTLAGTKVTIAGIPAYVDYVSAVQVNAQAPLGIPPGSQSLVVTTAAGSSAPFNVSVASSEPGLLAPPNFNINGTQYAAALFSDGTTFVLPPGAIAGINSRRASPGDTITLYGIGFGLVNTNTLPGQIAQQLNSLASSFTASVGGMPAKVSYDGLVPTFVGLYQFNVVIPQVAASDAVPLTFSLGGASGTQKLAIPIGN